MASDSLWAHLSHIGIQVAQGVELQSQERVAWPIDSPVSTNLDHSVSASVQYRVEKLSRQHTTARSVPNSRRYQANVCTKMLEARGVKPTSCAHGGIASSVSPSSSRPCHAHARQPFGAAIHDLTSRPPVLAKEAAAAASRAVSVAQTEKH